MPEAAQRDVGRDVGHVEEGHVEDVEEGHVEHEHVGDGAAQAQGARARACVRRGYLCVVCGVQDAVCGGALRVWTLRGGDLGHQVVVVLIGSGSGRAHQHADEHMLQ